MASYFEIKNYLEAHKHDDIGQFGIDWIEKTLDEWAEREFQDEKRNELTLDDETMNDSTHYEAETILDVLRADALCRPFFEGLERLTAKRNQGVITKGLIESWEHDAKNKPPVVRFGGR